MSALLPKTAAEVAVRHGTSKHLDHRHDYVCLNFSSNLTVAMSVRNRGRGVVGCSLQFSRVSGLDFIAKRGSLAIGNGRMARRGCATLFGFSFDRHTRETGLLQLAANQRRVVVAVRRTRQKAWRIIWKEPCESVRHVVGENVLLDAIPNVESKTSSGLQDSLASL